MDVSYVSIWAGLANRPFKRCMGLVVDYFVTYKHGPVVKADFFHTYGDLGNGMRK